MYFVFHDINKIISLKNLYCKRKKKTFSVQKRKSNYSYVTIVVSRKMTVRIKTLRNYVSSESDTPIFCLWIRWIFFERNQKNFVLLVTPICSAFGASDACPCLPSCFVLLSVPSWFVLFLTLSSVLFYSLVCPQKNASCCHLCHWTRWRWVCLRYCFLFSLCLGVYLGYLTLCSQFSSLFFAASLRSSRPQNCKIKTHCRRIWKFPWLLIVLDVFSQYALSHTGKRFLT